ncbi:MAG: (5-formylfuran-3-yl)methyl phosphate synthase [Hyphomicrobium sp.]|uniref:(5-formylfuran-3-yl)methyl phosphate synthase n=1 Tax=Hyphomicrobium sp. TaxID=82 RepID=UPI0039E6BB79
MIDGLRRGKPAFLASVTNAGEAEIALAGGADIVDCKDPASGALGALSADTVREIVERVAGRVPVSATVGDLPADPYTLVNASAEMAKTGVDIVKIGFFGEGDARPAIAALGAALAASTRLVAVLMADKSPDFRLLSALSAAGFEGAMLDTADKSAGRLTSVLALSRLTEFVRLARDNDLFVGLAGSLKESDIGVLAGLGPDMLGFRGALCAAGRVSGIELNRVAAIRRGLDAAKLAKERETSVA